MKTPVLLAGLAISLTSACAPSLHCTHLTDCPGASVCSADGRCVVSEAPEVIGSGSGVHPGASRADPDDQLSEVGIGGGFAGTIGDTTFTDPAPGVDGSSDGYVAYQLTTVTPEGAEVGMWFDIPLPSLTPEGETATFTLEEMYADGTLPCISIWGEGLNAWADDYEITVSEADKDGNVTLTIGASNANSDVTAVLTVPRLVSY